MLKHVFKFMGGAASCLVVSSAYAQGPSIVYSYGPAATDIPAVSTGVLVALGVLLAILGARVFRQGGSHLSVGLLIVAGAGLFGVAFHVAESDATTTIPININAACDAGGTTVSYFSGNAAVVGSYLQNDCAGPIEIKDITFANPANTCVLIAPTNNHESPPLEPCAKGKVLASGARCDHLICDTF